MIIKKIIYNDNLRKPDSYTIECGGKTKMFNVGEEEQAKAWIESIWKDEFFPSDAIVYYNIDWDSDHVLYCKYRLEVK